MSLTDRAIINLKPNGKQSKHFDGGGLHLVVYPTGGKAWRLSSPDTFEKIIISNFIYI